MLKLQTYYNLAKSRIIARIGRPYFGKLYFFNIYKNKTFRNKRHDYQPYLIPLFLN
jgi:hypothetical protein